MENIFKATIAVSGSAVTYLWGEWSILLGILVAFVIFDYISGVMAAGYEGKLSSRIGFKAIPKKVMIFMFVAIGHLIDQAIGGDGHLFRDATIFFFMANELLSITENAGRMGVNIPPPIKRAIDVLKDRGDK